MPATARRLLLPLLLATVLAGCRRSPVEGPRLDVRPEASLVPASVPAGGPVAIAYRWTVGDSTSPLTGRYRAFVHVLDDEGALLFTDDHEPVPPPREWKPGHTYACRRLTLTPEFPFVGTASVVVGLYEESSGARLPLAGDDLGQRRFRVAALRLLPRDRDLPVRCEGFYPPEAPVAAPLVVSRFMRDEVVCRFPNPAEDVVLFVRADVEPQGFASPPRLTIASAGRPVAPRYALDLPLTTEVQMVRVRVPARALGRAPDAALAIRMSASYSPRTFGVADPRELSLRVFGMRVCRASRLDPVLREGVASLAQ